MSESLHEMLIRHEGLRLKPYTDETGHITIGIGRNLSDNGITQSEADMLFHNDIDIAINSFTTIFPEYKTFGIPRMNALIDMMFNLGIYKFLGFRNMISAIHNSLWEQAANEMRNSAWATQVPNRAMELANMVQNG